jgi:uncharacterized membrane protein required for colicin V production
MFRSFDCCIALRIVSIVVLMVVTYSVTAQLNCFAYLIDDSGLGIIPKYLYFFGGLWVASPALTLGKSHHYLANLATWYWTDQDLNIDRAFVR